MGVGYGGEGGTAAHGYAHVGTNTHTHLSPLCVSFHQQMQSRVQAFLFAILHQCSDLQREHCDFTTHSSTEKKLIYYKCMRVCIHLVLPVNERFAEEGLCPPASATLSSGTAVVMSVYEWIKL